MAQTGKEQGQRGTRGDLEDFEDDLVLPSGSLSLHLSKDAMRRAGSMGGRPGTTHSDISASTSASGGSIIFSSSSSTGSTSESEDQQDTFSTTSGQFDRCARTPAQTRGGTYRQDTATSASLGEGIDDSDEEEDEKSDTLKANQLPSDFAEQLALSKAQAAAARGAFTDTVSLKTASPSPSNSKPLHDVDNLEAGFEIPSSVAKLSLSRGAKPMPAGEPAMTQRQPQQVNRPASRSSSSWSLRSSVHARSNTSHSQTSSSDVKTASSDDLEDDFFDGLELPHYLSGRDHSINTPPSSVDSNRSKKASLQAVLNEKMKARARLFETSLMPEESSAAQVIADKNLVRPQRSAAATKHIEKQDERFEDAFLFRDESHAKSSHPSPQTLPSSSSSRSFATVSSSHSNERLSLWPNSSGLSSRSASTRSIATVRPSRSSLNLLNQPAATEVAEDDYHSRHKSLEANTGSQGSTTSRLKSRPSLSNLSGRPSATARPRPSPLLRKASSNALADAVSEWAASTDRPSTSTAHYAQPTRASLARNHLPFATIGRSGSSSRPSTPLSAAFQSEPKPALVASPSANADTFSRLTRPTIASSAKSHRPTGSDPSGRTSAYIGRPVPSAPSSPLKAMKMVRNDSRSDLCRQPRRAGAFGDGSELDGIEDLPVNREKEKKFVKIPIRRRQSSGVASVESTPSTAGSQRNAVTSLQSQQATRRERIGGAVPGSTQALHRNTEATHTASRAEKHVGADFLKLDNVDKSVAQGQVTKRPHLKLIRNLSASGLSQGKFGSSKRGFSMLTCMSAVQGQMKWNPVLLKWEGNESSLREFDNVIASSTRPALISPLGPLSPRNVYAKSPLGDLPDKADQQAGHNQSISQKLLSVSNPHGTTPSLGGVRVVGDMIFDPVKRSWFSMSSEGEEELNFGDDEEDESSQHGKDQSLGVDAWEGGEQMRLRTRRSFANDWSSNASSHGDREEADWSFEHFSKKQKEAAKRHDLEMQTWKRADGSLMSTDRQNMSRQTRKVSLYLRIDINPVA